MGLGLRRQSEDSERYFGIKVKIRNRWKMTLKRISRARSWEAINKVVGFIL